MLALTNAPLETDPCLSLLRVPLLPFDFFVFFLPPGRSFKTRFDCRRLRFFRSWLPGESFKIRLYSRRLPTKRTGFYRRGSVEARNAAHFRNFSFCLLSGECAGAQKQIFTLQILSKHGMLPIFGIFAFCLLSGECTGAQQQVFTAVSLSKHGMLPLFGI